MPQPNTQSSRHPWLFSTLFIFLSLIFAFIVGETYCRIMQIGRPNPYTGPKQLFVPDPNPLVSFRMRPGYEDWVFGSWVQINEKGLRDQNHSYERQPDTKRILILGDSVAFGFGVPVEDTFSNQWEAWLNSQPGQNWEIINSGVPSYTSIQEINWFKDEGINYQPDAIVVVYVMNDPEPVHPVDEHGQLVQIELDNYMNELGALIPRPVLPFTQRSYLMKSLDRIFNLTSDNWKKLHEELTVYFESKIFELPSWQETQTEFSWLKQYCDENGIHLLVAIYPTMYRLHSVDDHPFVPHYRIVQQTLENLGITCIVPLEDYLGKNVNEMRAYEDDPHPSRSSHRIFAQRLHHELHGWVGYRVSKEWK